MKTTKSILRRAAVVYFVTSYLFFPGFLLRYVDFQQRTIFDDIGFSLGDLFLYFLLSPYYVAMFGTRFLAGEQIDGVPFHTVVYWAAFATLFALCWFVLSRVLRRLALSS